MAAREAASTTKVCVTGAGGFVGSAIVKTLIDQGFSVHGTVRDLGATAKIAALKKLGDVKLFAGDLTQPGSFAPAFQGCDAVIHVASPFEFWKTDAQQQFFEPAVNGTLNVLETCSKVGIHRVIMTGSLGSITSEQPVAGCVYDETMWNTDATQPYTVSKRMAEEAAFRDAAERGLALTVICPSFVLGAPLMPCEASISVNFMRSILSGRLLFPLAAACVSLSDVALAHVRALQQPKSIGLRIIVSLPSIFYTDELLDVLKTSPLASSFTLPDLETLPPLPPKLYSSVSNKRAVELLGMSFSPFPTFVVQMAEALLLQKTDETPQTPAPSVTTTKSEFVD